MIKLFFIIKRMHYFIVHISSALITSNGCLRSGNLLSLLGELARSKIGLELSCTDVDFTSFLMFRIDGIFRQ